MLTDRSVSQSEHLKQLEDLLKRVESAGITSLNGAEALRFGQLYRQAAAELSRARSRKYLPEERTRLNSLVSRAYRYVYAAPPASRSGGGLFKREIPQSFRKNFTLFVIVWLFMIAGGMVGAYKFLLDPASAEFLVGKGWFVSIEQVAARHAERQDWLPEEMRTIAAAGIGTNNILVAVMTFAMGAFAGVGSLLMILRTGAMVGAVSAGVHSAGASVDFWAFIAPHGVPELTAIVLAAVAGFRIGWALVDPGDLRRPEALKTAGTEGLRLVIACICLLVWAALIEAFISPALIPYSIKYTVSAVQFILLCMYFGFSGRTAPKAVPDA